MSIKKILLWILFIILSSFTALLLLGATIQISKGFNSSYIIPLLLTAFLLFIDIKLWEKLRVGKLLTTKNPEIIQQKATSINNEPVTVENKQQIQQTNKETANNIDNYEYFSCPVFGTNYKEKDIKSLIKNLEQADEFQKTDEWSYSAKKADEEFITDRIWKYEPLTINAALEPEPDNAYDHNAIKVLAENSDGEYICIGYIPKTENKGLLKIIHNIDWVKVEIKGGKYKELNENDNGNPVWEQGSTNYNFEIMLRYKK
jgi:hypothetical protein